MRKILVFFTLLLVSYLSFSQPNNQKPKLVVGIVIDQLRYDIIDKYWYKFSDSGFKKLINEGTYCKNTYYKYLNINSASGCATISCGSYPSQHGIINNSWYDRIKNTKQYCVDDASYITVGSTFGSGKSPKNLSSLTWTDQLRISSFKMSKVYSVGIKDYASILSGGKLANAAYWFDENTGRWVTSSFYMDSLKNWVKTFNNKKFTDIYLSRKWETTLPIQKYIESLSDATAYEIGINGQTTFPYDLGVLKSKYNNYSLLKYTPYANTFTKDFAINLLMNEHLGRDAYTDALLINFAATSFIGDLFGIRSVEMEDTYIKLDKDISHLIAAVEDYVGADNVIFYITSDRGSCDNQQWLHDINITTGEFNPTRSTVIVGSYLRAIYGLGNWIEGFYNDELYLDQFEIDKASQSVEEFQQKAAQILVNISGISTVIQTSELQKGTFSAGIMQQAQNSYFKERSGDLFIVLDYGWRLKNNTPSLCNCNSAFNENSHIPLIFYGGNIKHQSIYSEISADDIATTLCFLLNIPLPNKSTGKPISELLE